MFRLMSILFLSSLFTACLAQVPGTAEEPIRYIGQPRIVDQHYHDGQLRPAVGVKSYQTFRANRTSETGTDGSKNRYNHSPMLA